MNENRTYTEDIGELQILNKMYLSEIIKKQREIIEILSEMKDTRLNG